jgi:acyl-CoA thioester hydrolase
MDLFMPPPGRETFRLDVTPTEQDFDELGHVNNVVYVRLAQQAGTAHWLARASAAQQGKWLWVALRHEIDYRRPTQPGEALELTTWVGEPDGPRFDRFVSMQVPGADRWAARSRTTWCLIEADRRRPRRIAGDLLALFSK